MSGISTHILDTERGRPAAGIPVILELWMAEWRVLTENTTDANGRIAQLLPAGEPLRPGLYRLTFRTAGPFFPEVSIVFKIEDASSHYHVPLLLSSWQPESDTIAVILSGAKNLSSSHAGSPCKTGLVKPSPFYETEAFSPVSNCVR